MNRPAFEERLKAWAIRVNSGFIGHGSYGWMFDYPWVNGVRVCFWATRALARRGLEGMRGPAKRGLFPEARVVRVEVVIREIR